MSLLDQQWKDAKKKGRVEFLPGDSSLGAVASHVTAFLNSGGGMVVVKDSGRTCEKLDRDLRSLISPQALFSVTTEDLNAEPVVVIEVPGGKDLPFVCDGMIFVRKGEATAKAAAEDLQGMLQRQAIQPERWERRAALNFHEEDFSQNELNQTFSRMHGAGDWEWAPSDVQELLKSLGCLRSDGSYTNAADVCFGETPGIRNPQIRLRAYAFVSATDDRFNDHQDFDGPITELIEQARRFIARNVGQRAEFSTDLTRTDQSVYPEAAVREALVNAVAHRDYSAHSGGVILKVYPRSLEIWNSGALPEGWSQRKLHESHPSIPNNPDIAHFLYHRGFMERIGRGTLKILEACRQARLPEPKWASGDGVKLTFFVPSNPEELKATLNERQQNFLTSTPKGKAYAPKQYREEFASGVGDRTARRDLEEMESAGLLRREGKGPATLYIRT